MHERKKIRARSRKENKDEKRKDLLLKFFFFFLRDEAYDQLRERNKAFFNLYRKVRLQ
jgi:hypothetical protein